MGMLIESENITNIRAQELPLRFLYHTDCMTKTAQFDHQPIAFIIQANGLSAQMYRGDKMYIWQTLFINDDDLTCPIVIEF